MTCVWHHGLVWFSVENHGKIDFTWYEQNWAQNLIVECRICLSWVQNFHCPSVEFLGVCLEHQCSFGCKNWDFLSDKFPFLRTEFLLFWAQNLHFLRVEIWDIWYVRYYTSTTIITMTCYIHIQDPARNKHDDKSIIPIHKGSGDGIQ